MGGEVVVRDVRLIFEKPKNPQDFVAVRVGLASPDKMLQWSHGEVKKPETINYRTFKPERDGLFCARIFGPVRDFECLCGKYKRMKYRGMVCEKCGVEVIQAKVRRERMGHIKLAAPVAHIWFLKSIPSRIGNLLDLTYPDLERVLYFESYIVIDPGKVSQLKEGQVISEAEYRELLEKHGPVFEAGMGAEAIKKMLSQLDLEALSKELRGELRNTTSDAKRRKLIRRLKVVESVKNSGNKPEWMILEVLPVIPPELRPLVPLDGGRFAISDLNDLYRRVINRNNRLKRLLELGAPEIIIKNEKRMLQEAVDALFDNGRRGRKVTGTNNRPLKSLSDMLKGKQGRFRQNLLGKRVDFSGRSVIVVGPDMRLHQCGLPKKIALELFKPFIFQKLMERDIAPTIKLAKKMVEQEDPVVWDILEEIAKEHPVLLNRAPTLHRLGIQAFEPALIDEKAIRLHPLACFAYNADFDGDQMAVHLPLSVEAQVEARSLMLSSNNILMPAYGKPLIAPSQDMVLGAYYMTKAKVNVKGEGMVFSDADEVWTAYYTGKVDLHAEITCRVDGERCKTTVGRVILYDVVPKEIPFSAVNKVMNKKLLSELLDVCYRTAGAKKTVILADKLRDLGFAYATKSGLSISIKDLVVPSNKEKIIDEAHQQVKGIWDRYLERFITPGERYNEVIDVWTEATRKIKDELMQEIGVEYVEGKDGESIAQSSFNPIYMMADSGARGSEDQIKQLAGMRGLMAKPSGEIIETPITANFREGLSVLQYFISTHGARKGLADTALKTANSGYLTRRLVDVAQDVIITVDDCGTKDGIEMKSLVVEGGEVTDRVSERVLGRVALRDVHDPVTGELIVEAGSEIDEEAAAKIDTAGIESVLIRSLITCEAEHGVCVKCYGRDLAHGRMVDLGEAVGVVAAQSIGEPGTQLTMRTFHSGGTASKGVEQKSFEARLSGIVSFDDAQFVRDVQGKLAVMNRTGRLVIRDAKGHERESFPLPYGARLPVREGQKVKVGDVLVEWDPYSNPILTAVEGYVTFEDLVDDETIEEVKDETTGFTKKVVIPSSNPALKPRVLIVDDEGMPKKQPETDREAAYYLPFGAYIEKKEGDHVYPGDVIAKIPRELTRTKDITGGLPRVAELFEARKPRNCAIVSEIDGWVSVKEESRGLMKIVVKPDTPKEKSRDYVIPRGRHIVVQEGDYVRAGDSLTDGSPNPHDILKIKGIKELARYLIDEVQEVYRLQGVKINEKHFEIIARQMLRRVKVEDPGDTRFLPEDQVEIFRLKKENERVVAKKGKPAVWTPMLLGITKASLFSESFLSAASFQETTRVLTDAALRGKVDDLMGLKENVLMGRLIPAGTGIPAFSDLSIEVDEPESEEAEGELVELGKESVS